MKAKFGIASIGCFVAFVALVFCFCVYARNDSLLGLAIATYFTATILGVVFGIVGAVKKEKPMVFYCVGLALNLGWILLAVLMNIFGA